MPTILLKKSDTPGSVPGTANLTNLAGGAEVAVNTADKRMFSMTSASAVIELGTNPSSLTCADASFTVARVGSLTISSLSLTNATFASATITNLTSTSATISSALTLSGGTANGVLYLNGSKEATSGSAFVFDGTNVGIGTSSPAYKLDVNGVIATGSGANRGFFYNDGSKILVESSGTYPLSFAVNSAVRATIDSSGNVGIGTSSPAYKLDVAGAINSSADVISQGNDARISLYRSAGINYFDWASGQSLYFSTQTSAGGAGRSTKMVLTDGGNLGIGTSSPGTKLSIYGNGVPASITVENSSGARNYEFGTGYAGAGSAANFYIWDNTANAGRLILDSSGNFGIGTSSPGAKLEVSGEVRVYPSSSPAQIRFGVSGVEKGKLAVDTSSNMIFETAGSERLRLDSSGNLGLGVTPSAWSSGISVFEFGTKGGLAAAPNDINFIYNSYYDGVNSKYRNSDFASYYQQAAGQHRWYTAPSGTAGNTISFTQAMTLDASGNLGIGETSPDTRAHIYGANTAGRGQLYIQSSGTVSRFVMANSSDAQALNTYGDSSTSLVTWDAGSGYSFRWTVADTERARITAGGDFGIGNANPSYRLTVDKDTTSALAFFTNSNNSAPNGLYVDFSSASPNDSTRYFLYCEDSTAQRATIRSNGGLANYQSNNVDLSDIRTKKDIAPAASMWDKIGALEIVTYKYNDQTHDDVNVGVIAQQVESVEPVWVDADGFGETPEGEEPLKTVYTKDITFAAIKALQEAMARIEKLEAEVAALKGA